MNRVQLIRDFASQVAGEKVVIARIRDDWGITLGDVYPRLILPRNLDKCDEGDKAFRKNFVERCPMAQGFAHVTLSVLHEIGHHFHRIEYITQDPKEYDEALGDAHFDLPCERVATDWAIEWLQDKAHRRMAKEFEKKYFAFRHH